MNKIQFLKEFRSKNNRSKFYFEPDYIPYNKNVSTELKKYNCKTYKNE